MEHEMKQRKFIELRDSFKFQDYLILLKSTFVTITDCIMIDFLWLSFNYMLDLMYWVRFCQWWDKLGLSQGWYVLISM